MGASDFRNVIKAKTPEIGFKNLNGGTNIGGYTGNIRSKPGFVLVPRPKGMRASPAVKALQAVANLYEEPQIAKAQRDFPTLNIPAMREIYHERFGSALCMELKKGHYIFAGTAAE